MDKRIYRSTTDKKLAGVCGGIAEHFNIDPTIVRLIFVFLALTWFTGVILYIAAALIIPEKPQLEDFKDVKNSAVNAEIIKEAEKDREE